MKIWHALLLVALLVSVTLTSCDYLGISSKSKEQKRYEQQVEAYQKQQEAYQKQMDEYYENLQKSLDEYNEAYADWQKNQVQQEIQAVEGGQVVIVTANQTPP
jgi:transposase